MQYWLVRAAALLARRAPLRVGYACGRLGGYAAFYLWRGGRQRCIQNMMRVAGGDRERARALARASFANYGLYLVDFLRFQSATREELRRRVVFDGWSVLDEALAGDGALFVTLHFGNWDMGAAALADRGYPMSVIADTFANPRLNEMVLGARRHLGMRIVPAERMGPGLLRALRDNDVVAGLIDVPAHDAGVEVDFFGEPIAVHGGLARLALRTGSSVIAATVRRLGPWTDRVTGDLERVRFSPTGDADADAQALTQAIMHALERMVRAHPDQWYIFRPLWVADATAARSG